MNKKEIEKHRRLLIELVREKDIKIKDLQQRIDKTIDFIDNWEKYKKDKGSLEVTMLDLLYIKEILGDKENEN